MNIFHLPCLLYTHHLHHKIFDNFITVMSSFSTTQETLLIENVDTLSFVSNKYFHKKIYKDVT